MSKYADNICKDLKIANGNVGVAFGIFYPLHYSYFKIIVG